MIDILKINKELMVEFQNLTRSEKLDLVIKEMEESLNKLANENSRLKTYLAASIAQIERHKQAFKKLVEDNHKLEEDVFQKTNEI